MKTMLTVLMALAFVAALSVLPACGGTTSGQTSRGQSDGETQTISQALTQTLSQIPAKTDMTTREAELKQALIHAQKVQSYEVILPEGVDPNLYARSVTDIQAKYDLLQQAKRIEGNPNATAEQLLYAEQARAIAASSASPFINVFPRGISLAEFQEVGFRLRP